MFLECFSFFFVFFWLLFYHLSLFFYHDFRLTNDKLAIVKFVFGDFEVEGSRTLSDSTGDIVVRTVARAEPTVVVTGLTNGDTTQMGADTQHNEPSRVLDTLLISLGVS